MGRRLGTGSGQAYTVTKYMGSSARTLRGGMKVASGMTGMAKRFGGIVSFRVTGGEQQALDVCAATEVFTLGESLGGVESLIEHRHRPVPAPRA